MSFDYTSMKPQLQLIVKAIQKGAGPDVREYRQATNKVTNNAVRLMLLDNIFTNIRDCAASETLELKTFKRFGWDGCLLIDRVHKLTFTICTKRTLEGIPRKKDRSIPHYLQSILFVENSDVKSPYVQPNLFGYEPKSQFSEEVLRDDYESIMKEDLSAGDGYHHWCIVYEVFQYDIASISMIKLDKNFLTAEEIKLDDLLKPDFLDLTEVPEEAKVKDVHSLISVKPVLKGVPAAPIKIEVKMMEEDMHA